LEAGQRRAWHQRVLRQFKRACLEGDPFGDKIAVHEIAEHPSDREDDGNEGSVQQWRHPAV
jgi:hypothetical protein